MVSFSRSVSEFSAQERIVIIEPNWLGDVLFTTPAIRAVRKKHPGAFITGVVVPRCKTLLLGNNYLDEVLALDETGRYKGLIGRIRLIRDLRIRRFNTAYILRPSLTRTICLWLAGVRKRVAFSTRKTAWVLTDPVKYPTEKMHRADTYYYLIMGSRIPDGERRCDLFVSDEDRSFIENFLKKHNLGQGKILVCLHVGGNWGPKRWPKENFAHLIRILKEMYDADLVLTGSYMDYPLASEIAQMSGVSPFIACGLTTLKQAAVLFQRSQVVISADSGPLHMAAAIGARVLSIFGPTSPELTGPLSGRDIPVLRASDLECEVPCYNQGCQDNVCMKSISVDQVIAELENRGWLKP